VSQTHWLFRIAERAGIVANDRPELDASVLVRDAWGEVSRSLEIPDRRLSELVAQYFRLKVSDLSVPDAQATEVVPEAMARQFHIFPLMLTDRHLVVATSDPTDLDAERSLGFTSGRTVVFQVASPAEIQDALDQAYSSIGDAVEGILGGLDADGADASVAVVEESGPESISVEDVDSGPVIRLTNLILRDAIEGGASDIHVEPGRGKGNVRYRVDGVLRSHMELPMAALNRVISRIKILSKLDIADRLRPQDGKARVRVNDLAYDLRVSTIPAGGAEKCVIRILDSNAQFTLDDLDLPEHELTRFRELLTYREGIVLVTGPTGSGKTTTLYGALRELADGKVNIMTVEDPVEYELGAVTQTQVETKQGMTFAGALRAILRQDPDVILVGEIRDRETAETAAQAALTGHLVLATVHANDAVSAVARMGDLGLQYSTIASALRGALAQRLLRRVCAACAEPVRGVLTPEEQVLTERYEAEPMVRAVGCTDCGFTGYRGRIPVQEVLIAGPRLQQAIEMRKGHTTLQQLSIQSGMRTMLEVAVDWVVQGKTTLVEVERVLGQVIDEEKAVERKGPPKILVVDDDEDARLMMASLLEEEGYEVTRAQDGTEAVDVLKEDPHFSLVVLDLFMPKMDGREVLQWIRGSVDTAAVPVVVRTGMEGEESEAELLEAGADDYLTKALEPERFRARVRAILRRAAL
jgi:type II secretory ATPase GspE/PulE/Tfp pilus assembly ATPase PilB-like protein/ActR/RegA family two-component response regulator